MRVKTYQPTAALPSTYHRTEGDYHPVGVGLICGMPDVSASLLLLSCSDLLPQISRCQNCSRTTLTQIHEMVKNVPPFLPVTFPYTTSSDAMASGQCKGLFNLTSAFFWTHSIRPMLLLYLVGEKCASKCGNAFNLTTVEVQVLLVHTFSIY